MAALLGIKIKRAFGDVRVILSGELDRSVVQALEDALEEAGRRARRLEVDLTDLSFIDGGGLRVLEQAGERASRNGHELVLSNPTPWIRELFELCDLDRYVVEGGELTHRS